MRIERGRNEITLTMSGEEYFADLPPLCECGIAVAVGPINPLRQVVNMGEVGQHRGYDSFGVAVKLIDERKLRAWKGLGEVMPVVYHWRRKGILPPQWLVEAAIAHVRYATQGKILVRNCPPILIFWHDGRRWRYMAIVQNGDLTNMDQLRAELGGRDIHFNTTNDGEVFGCLIMDGLLRGMSMLQAVQYCQSKALGGYSVAVLTDEGDLWLFTDPRRVRPLAFGSLNGGFVANSETDPLVCIGANHITQAERGQIIHATGEELEVFQGPRAEQDQICIFDQGIYLSSPASYDTTGLQYAFRRFLLGRELAREHPVRKGKDVVVLGMDRSGIHAAVGFAKESGIPFVTGISHRLIRRMFLKATAIQRAKGVVIKIVVIVDHVSGKRIVLVDDSTVRGTTLFQTIGMLRQAGAKEVHVRISSAPYRYPCFYGINTPTKEELIASGCLSHGGCEKRVAQAIDANSVGYLSIYGMCRAMGLPHCRFCLACFNGNYSVPPPIGKTRDSLDQKVGLSKVRPNFVVS